MRRQEQSDRVESILEAACRVIERDGWHGLRMDGVAREAGVSKALVHYYFATRRALLRAAFAYSEERANARVESELEALGSPRARLERFLLSDLDEQAVFSENRTLWSEVWSGMRLDAELRPEVETRYGSWVARLVELVEEAQSPETRSSEEDVALRLAALVDGAESLLAVGLASPERARALLRDGISDALAPAARQTAAAHSRRTEGKAPVREETR